MLIPQDSYHNFLLMQGISADGLRMIDVTRKQNAVVGCATVADLLGYS